jgi:hypothetical protein
MSYFGENEKTIKSYPPEIQELMKAHFKTAQAFARKHGIHVYRHETIDAVRKVHANEQPGAIKIAQQAYVQLNKLVNRIGKLEIHQAEKAKQLEIFFKLVTCDLRSQQNKVNRVSRSEQIKWIAETKALTTDLIANLERLPSAKGSIFAWLKNTLEFKDRNLLTELEEDFRSVGKIGELDQLDMDAWLVTAFHSLKQVTPLHALQAIQFSSERWKPVRPIKAGQFAHRTIFVRQLAHHLKELLGQSMAELIIACAQALQIEGAKDLIPQKVQAIIASKK